MIHELKTLPLYFEAIIKGEKTFEVRRNDRLFMEGDILALNEYDNTENCYTGRSCIVYVDYILENTEFIKDNYVIMSIKPCTLYLHTNPVNFNDLKTDYSVPLVPLNKEHMAAELQ